MERLRIEMQHLSSLPFIHYKQLHAKLNICIYIKLSAIIATYGDMIL